MCMYEDVSVWDGGGEEEEDESGEGEEDESGMRVWMDVRTYGWTRMMFVCLFV